MRKRAIQDESPSVNLKIGDGGGLNQQNFLVSFLEIPNKSKLNDWVSHTPQ